MTKYMFWGLGTIIFWLVGCIGDEAAIQQLLTEKKMLTCKMEQLKIQNDSFWNEMTIYLDDSLPTDIPLPERTNMVNTHNSHLLTVFRVFPLLDTAIQNKIYWAGKIDAQMAERIKSIMEQLHTTERKLNIAFENLEQKDKSKFHSLKEELQKQNEKPCLAVKSY